MCALLTFTHALAALIVSDNFNDNSLDTTKWGTSLFSGFIPEDQGVRLSDHNWIFIELGF